MANYIAMSGAIVVNSSNNKLRVDVAGTTEDLTIPDGTYYLVGLMTDPSSIFYALKIAFESHSTGPTFTATSISGSLANGTAVPVLTWGFSLNVTATVTWLGTGTTFDSGWIGKSGVEGPTNIFFNLSDPIGFWLSDQPAESESKPVTIRDVKQNRSMDGGTFSFQKGYVHGEFTFGFSFISPERTLVDTKNALVSQSQNRTMQTFLFYAGNGEGIRVMKVAEAGSTLTVLDLDQNSAIVDSNTVQPGAAAMFYDWKILASSTNVFAPSRYSAGLELYSFEVGLLAKRNY